MKGVSSCMYAPRSATIRTLSPVSVPSRLAPSVTCATWSRPWWDVVMCSERDSVHFTGRPTRRASASTSASSA